MKIKVLKYKLSRGGERRVQSHNLRKGKWVENPNYDIHDRASTSPYSGAYDRTVEKMEVAN